MLSMIITAIPTVIGVTQGLRYQDQAKEDDGEPHWFNLFCAVYEGEKDVGGINGAQVVLIANKLFLLMPNSLIAASGFPFTGLFHDYPFQEGLTGMVSHIQADPPALNWIFANKASGEMQYGTGSESKEEGNVVGEWTHENVITEVKTTEGNDNSGEIKGGKIDVESGKVEQKKKIVLDGEGDFVAVEKEVDAGAVVENLWQIFWSRGVAADEGLRRIKVNLMVEIKKEEKKEGEGGEGKKEGEGGEGKKEGEGS